MNTKKSGLTLAAAPAAAGWPPASITSPGDPHFKWAPTVMFDLHGVIFDWESAFQRFASAQFGYGFSLESRSFYDLGRDPSTPISPKQFSELFLAFVRRANDGYGELTPIPGVIEQIELIAAAGIKPVICTYTPGASDVRPDGSTTYQTGIARKVTMELIERHLGHVIKPQDVIFSSHSGKKHVMLDERIPLIVEDKAATAVDVAESALAAIVMPQPYNKVQFPNVLRLESYDQLADTVLSFFEAIEDAGRLAAK